MKTSVTAVLLLACAAVLAQETPKVRRYTVAEHGVLKLSVPPEWTDRVESERGMPPTIVLTSPGGDVVLQVTALWSPDGDPAFNSTENIHAGVAQAAEAVQPTAVERKLVLRPLKTASGEGRFFWATDRAPKAGEYEYMANGAVPAGQLLLSFTVLTHVQPPAGIEEGLGIVASAVHEQ